MWKWFGRLNAVAVMATFYAAIFAAVAVLGDDGGPVAFVPLFALFVAYCCARPRRGGDVLWASFLPGGASLLGAELLGIDRLWLAVPLTVISFVMLWTIERNPDDSWGGWGEKPRDAGAARRQVG